jgi:Polyketide cyclase / dehydrase and lipid transport
MSTYKMVEDILAAPDTVFAVLCDVDRWPNWTPTMTRVKRLEGGVFGLGSRTELEQPKLKTTVWTVSDFVAGQSFTWVTRSPGVLMTAAHAVEAHVSGCRVTLSIEVRGWLQGLVTLLYGRLIHDYVTTEGRSLKSHCEALASGQKQVPVHGAAAP